MRRNGTFHRFAAAGLIVCLLLTLAQSVWVRKAEAARADDVDVRFFNNMTQIGNATNEGGDNAFINFDPDRSVPGFYSSESGNTDTIYGAGDVFTSIDDDSGASTVFQIQVANNQQLRELASSGTAEVIFGWDELPYYDTWLFTRYSEVTVAVDGTTISRDSEDGTVGKTTLSPIRFTPTSVIRITVYGSGYNGSGPKPGVRGMSVQFQDKVRPTLDDYTFTGTGAMRDNTTANQRELYVKENENITLTYNFSEPVKPSALRAGTSDYFLRHPLFVNDPLTGLPEAGLDQYLTNQTYTADNLTDLSNTISYSYTGVKYHNSSNRAVQPRIAGSTAGGPQMNLTLEEKLNSAVLTDAAGNVADISLPGKAKSSTDGYLDNKTVDPFDYKHGGFAVIIDAVAPKYTKGGNGIQPEILTGSTLNHDDTILFTLQLTEEAIVKRGWDVSKTFIHFNNGMKAKYVSGEGTKNWTFSMKVGDTIAEEAPLLKVIAVTNEAKGDDSDKNVIQDYAGNLLIQPANYQGVHIDGNEQLVNSKIDWAELAIDNTKPEIGFRFEADGADAATYRKKGKITIDANDPQQIVPDDDPILADRGTVKPSRGIYRPSNMTGSASPSVGLVYYAWTRSEADPFNDEGKNRDNFAAIKRYSLTAKQPSDGLYPGSYADVTLSVVNNKTNLLAPPAEALTPEGSGVWYLHTWTADMTWDTTRELHQYAEMKTYVRNNLEQYQAWKDELQGASDADKTFYADNKALAAVGDYANESIWPLDFYKEDDSNWAHAVQSIRLDNQPPAVTLSSLNDNAAEVGVEVRIADAHSGVQDAAYQWVKDGEQPADIRWQQAALVDGEVTLSTRNEVYEDGKYWLYIKAADYAGNDIVKTMDGAVTVNSQETVVGSFSPPSDPAYVRSHDVSFHLEGIEPDSVAYAFSDSAIRPASESSYSALTAEAGTLTVTADTYGGDAALSVEVTTDGGGTDGDGSGGDSGDGAAAGDDPSSGDPAGDAVTLLSDPGTTYKISADSARNGLTYIHVKVNKGERYYYYSKAYYFDNQQPAVTFSKNGSAYPRDLQEVAVTVTEPYSKSGLVNKYLWVNETAGAAAPKEDSEGWKPLPQIVNGERVSIDGAALEPGGLADYRLYVWSVDGAGNSVIASTPEPFNVSRPADADVPSAPADSKLIYLYGDEEDGYTAILKLKLDTPDKAGYQYSVSHDGGASWLNWKAYTNFVSVKLPSGKASDINIQFKYRAPNGAISAPQTLIPGDLAAITGVEPVYAVAALNTTRPIGPAEGVTIELTVPLGIKAVPSAVNPSLPVRSGNKFTVKENGFYSFDLTDTNDAARKDTLYVVVSNIDSTPPTGVIETLNTAPTNGNVSVMLTDLSEPVTLTNNGGKMVHTFSESGSFTYEFKDEAGNIGTATATIFNIDKEGPAVKIVRAYAYGEDGGKTFGTIPDGSGGVLLSSGVLLEVQKADPAGKNFTVVGGSPTITMTKNGTASFIVADDYGNTTVVEEQVNNIVSDAPKAEVAYQFVDDNGTPLPAGSIVTIGGQAYAKGQVKVTLTGRTTTPNAVFAGTSPVAENGDYLNKISLADGAFTYEKRYTANGSTVIALSDLLGNVGRVPVTVQGLDNTPPELQLKQATIGIVKNKKDFNFRTDLGGFTVSDNVSAAGDIAVAVGGLDLTKTGRQTVTYTATDQVGNASTATQTVVVVADGGMLIFGNDQLISASSGETALFDTNSVTFSVTGYNTVNVSGQDKTNEWGTFDILYQPGLYREGQMKYIASKVTYKELVSGKYKVVFPQAGWYTVIVRNQEREREYATFFVGKVQ